MDETSNKEVYEGVKKILSKKRKVATILKWMCFSGLLCAVESAGLNAYRGDLNRVLLMGVAIVLNAYGMKLWKDRQVILDLSLVIAEKEYNNGVQEPV